MASASRLALATAPMGIAGCFRSPVRFRARAEIRPATADGATQTRSRGRAAYSPGVRRLPPPQRAPRRSRLPCAKTATSPSLRRLVGGCSLQVGFVAFETHRTDAVGFSRYRTRAQLVRRRRRRPGSVRLSSRMAGEVAMLTKGPKWTWSAGGATRGRALQE